MSKRLLSLWLMLALLLCAAVGLGEQAPSLRAARISALRNLAGENGEQWREDTAPSKSMNAFQMWQWTDWFLSNRVRSLLGTLQDMEQMGALDTQAASDQVQLRKTENTLSRFEAQLEEGRLAILNGIALLQSSGTSDAERQAALSRILEAESEINRIIGTICADYSTYQAVVNKRYTVTVSDTVSGSLAWEAAALETSENHAVSVISTHQFRIRVLGSDLSPVKDAEVTLTHPLNGTRIQTATDAQGDAVFWVGDLGADETGELLLHLRVESEGRRTREVETVRLRSGETRSVELQEDDGTPYLIMGCFDGRDILAESNTYYCTPQNTAKHAFSVKLHSDKDGELELRYPVDAGATEYATVTKTFTAADSDKTVFKFEDQWLSKLPPDARVSLTIKAGGKQYTTDAQLVIEKAMVEEPSLNRNALFSPFSVSGGSGLKIPDAVPFVGGSRLSVDIPDILPQTVYLPSYRALFASGYDFKPERANWQTRDAEDEARAVKEFEVKGKTDEALAAAGAHRSVNTTLQPELLGNSGAYVTPFAALQGLYRTSDQTLELRGTSGATMAFRSDISQTFSIGPAPFIAGVTLDMGTGFGRDVASTTQMDVTGGVPRVVGNPKMDYASGSNVSLKTDMRATSGMSVKDDATIDISGYGSLTPTVDFARGNMTAKLDMGMNATAQKLLTMWKSVAWEGKLGLPLSSGTVPGAPMEEEYLHFDNDGVWAPNHSGSGSIYGTSGVEPTETLQLFSQLDTAADDFQLVQIGTDIYLFWIQLGMGLDPARLKWYNLSELSQYKQGVIALEQVSYGEVSHLQGNNAIKRNTYTDYAFAVEASGNLCALTILSGKFPKDGSGKEPIPPSEACVTTVLMQRNDGTEGQDKKGNLEMAGYLESLVSSNPGEDYPIMPEVDLLINSNVSILSAYSTAGSPEKIVSLLCDHESGYACELGKNLNKTPFPTCADAAEINRYSIANVSASGQQAAFYALNAQGALSRLSGTARSRDLLTQGDIINFRVYAQPGTGSVEDRLFYLERVELEEGKYTQRLKSWTNTAAGPVITDYDVEIVADSFDIAQFGSGVYLYWTECSAPTGAAGQGIQPEYLVRCVRYDPGTDTVYGPFSLVELSERPNSVKLLDDGTGYYAVDLQSSKGSYVRQSVSLFTYTPVSAAELTAAAPVDPCVSAGDYAEFVFSVKNTGNVPLSGFNVKISDGSQALQTLHIDCINPGNNSSTMGTTVINGANAVRRISSMYDPLNHDSWDITKTQASRSATRRSVQTAMLMPGDTHSYTARLLVPANWTGAKSLTAAIDSVEGHAALNGAVENGVLMLTGVDDPNAPSNSRPGTDKQVLNTDAHDLMLSAQRMRLGGEDYVHITIRNRSGNTASSVKPKLTASFRGNTLYSRTFSNSMGDDFGYSMDVPLMTLTDGRSLPELELYVGSGNNAAYGEFADSDNHVRLLLTAQLCIVEHPVSIPAAVGKEAVFSVTAAGGQKPYRYQWQRMTGVNQWKDIPGADQDTYRIESVKNDQNGLTVRCVVTDQFGDSVTSDPAVLSLLPQTGDSSRPGLWLALGLASLAALAYLLLRGRKGSK